MKLSIRRFSLRALLIVVTAICCVLGYGANWKYQRRAFLAEQLDKRSADVMLSGLWDHMSSQNNVGKPGEGVYRDQNSLLFLHEQIKPFHHLSWQYDARYGITEAEHWRRFREVHNRKPKRAPCLLWMFNEQGFGRLDVVLTDGFTKREKGQGYVKEINFYTPRSHPTLEHARRLFPEAEVIPFVDRQPDGITRFEEVFLE